MPDTPHRVSLVTQSCALLRQWIGEGVWQEQLPGEAELGRRLRVSRVTLRAALAQLEREGLLKSSQGRRREILKPRRKRAAVQTPPDRVVLLSPVTQARLTAWKLLWIDELRELLAGSGLQMEFVVSAAAAAGRPERTLRELTARHRNSLWVLLQSTAQEQEWFAASGLRVLVAGSRYGGMRLPCVDVDYFAACRHAAGRLLARGCSRLALVVPRVQLAGDRESEAGFVEGAAATHSTVLRHDGTTDGLCRSLDELFAAARPDGLLVCHSTHAVTCLTHLLHLGVRVPRQVRVISRDDDRFLESVTPALSRYTLEPRVFAGHIARSVLAAAAGSLPVERADLLLPEFTEGGTL